MPCPRSRSLTCGLWMISPVRKTRWCGELEPRLIGVVDRAVDAVTEAELAREVHGEPAPLIAVVAGLDVGHQGAVVVGGELAGDLALEVEPFPEDQ